MAEDLRQMHTEGQKIRRGPVRVVDVSGIKPGEYGHYAGNCVVPRSTDSGRFENGVVFPPVLHRVLNDKFQVESEKMVTAFVDQGQRSLNDQPDLDQSMIGTLAGGQPRQQEDPEVTAARIRKVIEEDNEVERRLALEAQIREEVRQGIPARDVRAARQPAPARQYPAVSRQQYDPEPQPDLFSEMKTMMTDMFTSFQEQLDDIKAGRTQDAAPARAAVKKPRPADGLTHVAFTGDFGTIRAAYKTVSVADECIVLGCPAGELQSYDPPVDHAKILKLKVDEDNFHVVNAGLSFEYKGDRLTVLLRDNAHGNT